jgi:hypothetical protein
MRPGTNILRVKITLVCVEITLCVYPLHFASINHTPAYRNHTRSCQNNTIVCNNHTLHIKSHCAGGNCTLRVEITLVCVEIILERFDIIDLFLLSWGGGV